ncbi:MAG: ABC transporter permease subunit [Pseudomonadota bacterium]
MPKPKQYFFKSKMTLVPFNRWDMAAILLIFSLLVVLAIATKQMVIPYKIGEMIPISLDPSHLPMYALRSVLRIVIALAFSFLFTFIFGSLAAKSRHAERIIIPVIDILQSVPVLGFQAIAIIPFINLFHGSLLGPECAAIFAIFTAQAWNMILSFYQSVKTIPKDLVEAADMLHLSAWQRFWRLEVPFSMPGLLWNTMMSMSASWFFVVASEAITAANQNIALPGIGSYIALAIKNADGHAIIYAILTMILVIFIYDQLIFRPLTNWTEKFRLDSNEEPENKNWLLRFSQRTQLLQFLGVVFVNLSDKFINIFPRRRESTAPRKRTNWFNQTFVLVWYVLISLLVILASYYLVHFIIQNIPLHEIRKVFYLGFLTSLRVFAVVVFCTLVWLPLGVWIGMRRNIARIAQPIMQFLAAFPANLLFPIVVYYIVSYQLNVNIWVTPLMIIGTQWYVAFNIIAGTRAIPKDLHLVSANYSLRGLLRWQKFILPAIFPYYVTGIITAVGGAWNMSIVAEVVSWGNQTLQAAGLGAYITHYTRTGDFPRIALGISVMCIYVIIFNRVIWRPLYLLAEKRFRFD